MSGWVGGSVSAGREKEREGQGKWCSESGM